MSSKYRYVFLAVLGLVVSLYAARLEHTTYTAYLSVDSSGDTAEVMKITPDGIDSFLYHDSIRYTVASDTSNYDTVSWTSPSQKMQITLALDATVPDTSITYSCSLDLGTNITGFEYDPSGLDDTTVALLIDNLVDSFNNVTTIKDTILAEDSVSYIKIISKIAQIGLEGDARWTMKVSDSLDTTSTWTTSVATVCDTMVALVNALDSARFWTAYDSTTFYIIQSDDAGLDIFAVMTDTSQDSSHTQLNVTSYSTYQDTFKIVRMVWDDFEVSGIDFWVFLDSSITTTNQGFGLSDSAYIWIYKGRVRHGVEELVLVGVDTSAGLPCSLHIQITADTTGGGVEADTMWYEYWSLVYRIADTTSDTIMNPAYVIWVDYKLIGK